MSKQIEIKLTASEIEHIKTLIALNELGEEYYKPKDQHWKRSERIKSKLNIAQRNNKFLNVKSI